MRVDLTGPTPRAFMIPTMRPSCQDGVLIANGMLYWAPWMCTCPSSIFGHLGLAPSGENNVSTVDSVDARLEKGAGDVVVTKDFAVHPGDWNMYCGNNQRLCKVSAKLPDHLKLLWAYEPSTAVRATAPVAAGGCVFSGNTAGVVSALNAKDGKLVWKSYTGGQVVFPPAVWNGRIYAGSSDGWVYAWEAATGRLLWRFRAAPLGRRINVLGKLSSTWPVAGGVVVNNGIVYAAAGMADYDGLYVYALDAISGKSKWTNDNPMNGVNLQGALALNADGSRLYFHSVFSNNQAEYDLQTGKRLTPYVHTDNNIGGGYAGPFEASARVWF